MEKYNLFLDDIREPNDGYVLEQFPEFENMEWEVVRNYREFKKIISKKGLPEIISFDHDLTDFINGKEYTGFDCALWLVEFCYDNKLYFPEFRIHSANLEGKKNIYYYIRNARKYYLNG